MTCTHIGIEPVMGLEIRVVEVDPAPHPVWLSEPEKPCKRKVSCVRSSNSTGELTGPDLVSYFRNRWDWTRRAHT